MFSLSVSSASPRETVPFPRAVAFIHEPSYIATKEAAGAAARRDCGGGDCHTVLTFDNECAAVALGSNNVMGKGKDPMTWQAAETRAVEQCSANGGKASKALKHECSHE
jgi:hypothetical protein